tara:strand:+ start:112 stop:546 length:435 start_codon:yes stop_codon:yes gene_type:complete
MPVKSFRGLIEPDVVDQVSLHTNNGAIGYQIKKFQIIGHNPQIEGYESVLKIYSTPQTTVDGVINFSDNTLLGAIFLTGDHAPSQMFEQVIVIDNIKFNQDIYITHSNTQGHAVNYYIELEQVKLDLNENTVATLKDIRNIKGR